MKKERKNFWFISEVLYDDITDSYIIIYSCVYGNKKWGYVNKITNSHLPKIIQ